MSQPIIIKVGGSLLKHENSTLLPRLGQILTRCSACRPLLLVPGGGPFAELIRQYGAQKKLGEETCHFMALTAMDQYAYLLREFVPGSSLLDLSAGQPSFDATATMYDKPQILLCSRFLSQVPAAELPRSWDVTSDSLSAYLANVLNSSLLVILKSTDVDPRLCEPDIDRFFPALLPLRMPVWFINAAFPERVAQFLQTGSTQGVYLPPGSRQAAL